MKHNKITICAAALAVLLSACGNTDNIPENTATAPLPAATEAVNETTAAETTTAASETEAAETTISETEAETKTEETTVKKESVPEETTAKPKKEKKTATLPGRSNDMVDAEITELEYEFDAGLDGNIITGYTGKNKNIRFPAEIDGVKTVGVKLPETPNLNNIELPDSVVTIDFSYCQNLETIKLSAGLTKIPEDAFEECKSLTSIDIPNGITTIERGAFSSCKALASVTLPNTLTTIGESAFRSCGLEEITIPSSVTEIGYAAFEYCESLKTINFPNTPISFKDSVFNNCSSLEEVTLSCGIGEDSGCEIFAHCQNLKKVTAYGTLSHSYSTYNGTDYYCRDFRIFAYCPSLEEVVLISTPDTEFILSNSTFEECTALKTIDMSQCDNLVLCDYVFRECSSLQKLDLPDSTKRIIQRTSPFYDTSESLVVTYKGKEYNYTNFDEMFN